MADARDVAGWPSYDELAALVVELRAVVAAQQAEIVELKARLAANSRNSSRPSSSDGLGKPRADQKKRSLRKRSGRKPGGQDGHGGARLDRVAVPDGSVEHPRSAAMGAALVSPRLRASRVASRGRCSMFPSSGRCR